MSLIISPALISWLTTYAMLLFPHQPYFAYKYFVIGIFTLLFILGMGKSYTIPQLFKIKPQIPLPEEDKIVYYLLVISITIIMTAIFFLSIALPVTGNDQLEYMQVASKIFSLGTSQIYPLTGKDHLGGIYAGWTHPLGFVMLQVWNMIFIGTQGVDNEPNTAAFFLNSLIGPTYCLWTSLLIYKVLKPYVSRIMAMLGMLLYISVPLLFYLSYSHHIDPLRIATFTLAVYAPLFFKENSSWGIYLFLGVILGTALFSHSIGVLVIPIMAINMLLIMNGNSYIYTISRISFVVGTGSLFVLYRYIRSYIDIGTVIGDVSAVANSPILQVQTSTEIMRNIYYFNDKIFWGLLRGLSDIKFGFVYWILLFTCAAHICRFINSKNKNKILNEIKKALINDATWKTSLVPLVVFFGLASLTITLIDTSLVIKNGRYLLTFEPFVIVITLLLMKNYLCQKKI